MNDENQDLKLVKIDVKNQIAIITLNKPPVNALYIDLFNDISKALGILEKDDQIRVVIITGTDRIFSAGMDLKAVGKAQSEEMLNLMEIGYNFFQSIEKYSKPTIAAIRGHALGGGLGLAIACDIRIAGENAIFGLPESRIGFPFLWGVTNLFLRTVSRGPALDLILTGRNITAHEALQINLVKSVVPTEKVLDEALKLANLIINNLPSFAPKPIKAVLYEASRETSPKKVFDIENKYIYEILTQIDLKSWLKEYLSKK
ncbi:MAG: enoyl-CoA hydratase/isomerase family protein [Candidatus Lokiarchaeia archaeon]